jgi:hypothetical protein
MVQFEVFDRFTGRTQYLGTPDAPVFGVTQR